MAYIVNGETVYIQLYAAVKTVCTSVYILYKRADRGCSVFRSSQVDRYTSRCYSVRVNWLYI